MRYVDSVLEAGEQVTANARRHWIIFLRPLIWMCAGVWLFSASIGHDTPILGITGLILLMWGLYSLAAKWLDNWTMELAVTNKRVIYKSGFVCRTTIEMNMDKIETVVVDQSVLGRLLNYGTVHVKGTGQSIENLRSIVAPVTVRRSIAAR